MATAGENKQRRVKTIADPTISVSDLEKSIEAFMRTSKSRKLGKVLQRAMGGHSGNTHAKCKNLLEITPVMNDFANTAPNSMLPIKRLETAIEKCHQYQALEELPKGGIDEAKCTYGDGYGS